MDIRTATQLCMIDLAPLIEAGDFRQIGAAEDVLAAALRSAPDAAFRGAMLGRLSDKLAAIRSPTRPEADAYLRALRAIVRRNAQRFLESFKA